LTAAVGGRLSRWQADAALIGAALLFGATFVVVQDGVEDAEPIPFLGVRYSVAFLVLLPLARRRPTTPGVWRDGAVAGVALGIGYVLQTAGLQYTSSSTSAFITYLLVGFVPIRAAVVLRRPPSRLTIAGVAVAVVGLVLLTGGGDGFGRGELLTLGCALAFAAQIVVLARVAGRHDAVRLTLVQVAVVAGACLPAGLAFGGYRFGSAGYVAARAAGVGPAGGRADPHCRRPPARASVRRRLRLPRR
jgi:drug/metabolite transporter (DMT)-like permease